MHLSDLVITVVLVAGCGSTFSTEQDKGLAVPMKDTIVRHFTMGVRRWPPTSHESRCTTGYEGVVLLFVRGDLVSP